jgi:hypothetical protein
MRKVSHIPYVIGSYSLLQISSRVWGSVTNNNGLWVRWLDLLSLLYNYNKLWQLTVNDCLRLAPFLTGLRVSSTVTNEERRISAHRIIELPYESEWVRFRLTLLYDWWFTTYHFVLATSTLRLTTSNVIYQLNTCGYSPYVTSSLTLLDWTNFQATRI